MSVVDTERLAQIWAKIKAWVEDNRYIHPTTPGNKHVPAGGSDGQVLRYGGSSGTAVWGEDQDTTYGPATVSEPGLLEPEDKSKLDGIEVGANHYVHPVHPSHTTGLYKITVDGQGHVVEVTAVAKEDITELGIPGQDTDTTYTLSKSGSTITLTGSDGSKTQVTDSNTTYSAMTGATASAAGKTGLVPAPAAGAATRYLRSDGTWQVPPDTNTTYGPATTSEPGLLEPEDKTKLDGIEAGANKYVHPAYTPRTSGLYKITVDATGHISAVTAVTKADITALGIPGQDTNTWVALKGATASAAGTAGYAPAPAAGAANRYLRSDGTWQVPPNTTYGPASTTTAGLLEPEDKAKLDGIEAGANDYTHPAYTQRTSGLYKITVDAQGHVSAVTAVSKADITALGIPGQDTNTWIAFKGATTGAAGTAGYAPAPAAGAANRYLRSDGTWAVPPDTNTTYSAMTGASASAAGKSGLVPAPAAGAATRYLRSDGTWQVPPNTTYSAMKGATASAAGAAGLVPAPASGKQTSFLRGDGTWATPPNTTYSAFKGATTSAAGSAGLVPAPSAGAATRYLRSDGSWQVPPNTTYAAMTGATTSAAGKTGLVPAPAAGAANRYLRSDGTWQVPPNTTYTLASFGITATAAEINKLDGLPATTAELNFVDGVTSNIQTQLNGKATSGHTHPYAGSSSAGGAANSAVKLATARTIGLSGDASGSVSFDGSANVNIPAVVLHHGETNIPANANLNGYTDPGWYYCPANATAATLTNCPTTKAFAMEVLRHAGYCQILYEYMTSGYKVYIRNHYNGSWGAWARIYTTVNKPTASEIGISAITAAKINEICVFTEYVEGV